MNKNNIFKVMTLLGLFWSSLTFAEINVYQSTDNTGLNKREQIDTIEKYLTELSGSLKNMEAKLDANAMKLKTLEEVVKAIKDQDIKKIRDQLGQKKTEEKATASPGPTTEEMEKLKADILTLKNDDIEKVQTEIRSLNSSVEEIQKLLKINQRPK